MSNTRDDILSHAEHLARSRGANGFSYADLASELGIKKASVHYHFSTKADLLHGLIETYRDRFKVALAAFGQEPPRAKLAGLVDLYARGLREGELCLCGMLTLDITSLPEPARESLNGFFRDTEAWLTQAFKEGKEIGWQLEGKPEQEAKAFLALVQGAQLTTRAAEEGTKLFRAVVNSQIDRYQ